ncbi:protocadherin gamma-A11-like isoform X2 [Amblyraja radiata]|uniref:protocadherin gamma-A11-like isoform X2 n=1 Tax=Amblyraja radiata TaxID=386614 RepID=UPI00140289C3|nr:protocadherin gamma-A11-like isoform X2 [Amblyraja radiata]
MRCYNLFCCLKWELLCYMFIAWEIIFAEIHYSIPEELQRGAVIGNIADDLELDVKQLAARNFRLVSGPKKRYLEINLNNGILSVKERIDREELCGASLTCVLSLEAVLENPLSLYQIEVDIVDINDNSPSFPKSQFRLEISENTAPGARFILEGAHDIDIGTNSVQTYQLVANEYFALNVESGIADWKLPVLVLEEPLDREKYSTHRLLLIVKDGGVPERTGSAQINVVVEDANDNAPVFSRSVYKISLWENATKGALVLQVNATDLDDGTNGEIVYSLSIHTPARVREIFSVDSRTGEVNLNGNLDYEENNAFDIIIQAKDKGSNSIPVNSHILLNVLDVNDNAPEISLTSLSSPVSEDSLPGTVVALISTSDRDSGKNGQLRCQVENEVPFTLDSSSKKHLKLLTRQPLDRESASTHNVIISCRDEGSPPLATNKSILIEVSDRNDNAPQFSQPAFTAYMTENNNIDASIFSVTAFDPDKGENARLSFNILDSWVQAQSVHNYVYINSETGVIYSYISFDYEKFKNFQIRVQARDNGVPQLSSNVSVDVIILDQNDNAPVIVHPLIEHGQPATEVVSRFAEAGYPVTKVMATDADSGPNARLCYRILQATDMELFTIAEETGEIWTTRGITKTDATKQRLVVQVNDNGTPALSTSISIILSLIDDEGSLMSDRNSMLERPKPASVISFYLVISLGIITTIFLVILIILAVKVHNGRNAFEYNGSLLDPCGCFGSRHPRSGIQKASRNLRIPPNYVEVFGGDPLSQSYRYETCSMARSTKGDLLFPNTCSSSNGNDKNIGEVIAKGGTVLFSNCENYVHSEVKQPNADWHFSQAHRAELNSSQYLEEEGARREIQCEVQREVQRDVQREPLRDEPCEAPRNIQRDVPRDSHCDGQRAAENDPGGPRKPMCARPPAIPAGRDGWTLPRTAPRMQLQMTLGAHVPGTLRSQYLFPRDPLTPGARISNSSVEFSAFPVGSHHGPWAANQTRDCGSVADSGTRRPELDTETGGEIHRSPPSSRLPTQRLHSRDHHHALRQIND